LIAEDDVLRATEPLSAILGRSRPPRSPWRLVVYTWVEEGFVPMDIEVCRLDRAASGGLRTR
jgi:hypothetical protein